MATNLVEQLFAPESGAEPPSLGRIVLGHGQPLVGADRRELGRLFARERLLLMRGFQSTRADFVRFTEGFGADFMPYKGGAAEREVIDGNDTLLSVSVRDYQGPIPLHGEMYYRAVKPRLVWFYCEQPAETGGATIVGDGVQLCAALHAETRRFFETQRIKYLRFYPDGIWQRIFGTQELDAVRETCREGGVSMSVRFEDAKPLVLTEYVCSAITGDRSNGAPIFINNILAVLGQERIGLSNSLVRLEDGSKIPDDVVADLERAAAACTYPVQWKIGDLLMIDNTRFLHGRAPFTGSRSVLCRLCRLPAPDLGFPVSSS